MSGSAGSGDTPDKMADGGSHDVTLTPEHRERLLAAFPAPTITESIRASSLRGIEAIESSGEVAVSGEHAQVVVGDGNEVHQHNDSE